MGLHRKPEALTSLADAGTDEAEWRAATYEQLLRDDSVGGAIYDSLR